MNPFPKLTVEKFKIILFLVFQDTSGSYIQFLTGDYFNINEMKWGQHYVPFSSFNIFSLNDQPVVLGEATQNENKITGSRKASQLDEV